MADAVVRRQRDPAQHCQDALAVALARCVPGHVADQASQQADRQAGNPAEFMIGGQGAGHDQHRIGRHRQAGLFQQDVGEHDPEAVSVEQCDQGRHARDEETEKWG